MGAPPNDIGTNPPVNSPLEFIGGVATATGLKYGMVAIFDTGSTNFRDVKPPSGAAADGVAGVVHDQGDPNSSGGFAVGDEFALVRRGPHEVLLDAGEQCHAGKPAITGATAGTVQEWTNETDVDVVGTFLQDYDNSGGATPVLVSVDVGIFKKT